MYNYEDASGSILATFYFVALILMWALLFLNIIVALLLYNYNRNINAGDDTDLQEIEKKGRKMDIPPEILKLIIDNDLTAKTQTTMTWRRFLDTIKFLFKIKHEEKLPNSRYFKYKITRFLFYLVVHPIFNIIIFVAIISNTVILCLENYELDGDNSQQSWQEIMNYIFIAIFTLEVIIKFFGLGYHKFIEDRYNILDCITVILSIIEVSFSSSSGSYTALRAFRLLRIFKIFKAGELRILIDSLIKTIRSISPFIICLLIIMYIFVLIGMQLFAGQVKINSEDKVDDTNGTSPRFNFDTFEWALITVFVLFIGDGWNAIMYNTIRATETYFITYFFIVIIIGNIAMLQLFVAIMIENFTVSRKLSEKRKIIDEIEKHMEMGESILDSCGLVLGKEVVKDYEQKLREQDVRIIGEVAEENNDIDKNQIRRLIMPNHMPKKIMLRDLDTNLVHRNSNENKSHIIISPREFQFELSNKISENIDIENMYNPNFSSPNDYKIARPHNDAFMMSYESAFMLPSNRVLLDEEDHHEVNKDSSEVTQKRQFDDFFSEYDSVKTRRILSWKAVNTIENRGFANEDSKNSYRTEDRKDAFKVRLQTLLNGKYFDHLI